MHVHIYTHEPRAPRETADVLERDVLTRLMHYLRDEDGREDIALWEVTVSNTAWQGKHWALCAGAMIHYRFSLN